VDLKKRTIALLLELCQVRVAVATLSYLTDMSLLEVAQSANTAFSEIPIVSALPTLCLGCAHFSLSLET
jgi:hypothetical protein